MGSDPHPCSREYISRNHPKPHHGSASDLGGDRFGCNDAATHRQWRPNCSTVKGPKAPFSGSDEVARFPEPRLTDKRTHRLNPDPHQAGVIACAAVTVAGDSIGFCQGGSLNDFPLRIAVTRNIIGLNDLRCANVRNMYGIARAVWLGGGVRPDPSI